MPTPSLVAFDHLGPMPGRPNAPLLEGGRSLAIYLKPDDTGITIKKSVVDGKEA